MEQLEHLTTERENEKSVGLDEMCPLEIVTLMNEEDRTVAEAVRQVLPGTLPRRWRRSRHPSGGSRLIFEGPRTSGVGGRPGCLRTSSHLRTGSFPGDCLDGGGREAVFQAKEGAEDDAEAGRRDLQGIRLEGPGCGRGDQRQRQNPLCGRALRYAKEIGAKAISLSCNRGSRMSSVADVAIEVVTEPEVLTGSTRLKAGTAQKMVLNMLSTAAMVRLGKTYKNLMVDVKPTNEKLMDRARRILMKATGVSYEEAKRALKAADHQVKVALVMIRTGATAEEARASLEAAGGFVPGAVEG